MMNVWSGTYLLFNPAPGEKPAMIIMFSTLVLMFLFRLKWLYLFTNSWMLPNRTHPIFTIIFIYHPAKKHIFAWKVAHVKICCFNIKYCNHYWLKPKDVMYSLIHYHDFIVCSNNKIMLVFTWIYICFILTITQQGTIPWIWMTKCHRSHDNWVYCNFFLLP